jgi:AcrR family transcriptional regulator
MTDRDTPDQLRELPLAGIPLERADARRNRQRILEAAAELVGERGLAEVTMDEVAARAGVAKGTVFHRFGNRAGLARALVDQSERELQEAILRGPPPLGPGGAPEDRLVAFLGALLELVADRLDLLLVSDYDHPGQRFETGAYRGWVQHMTLLLREAGAGPLPVGLAHSLLAPLAADLVQHRLRTGATTEELKAELARLARSVLIAKLFT